MAGLNFYFRMLIKLALNGIFLQMLRSSVVEIPSSLDTKTIIVILFNLLLIQARTGIFQVFLAN